MPKENNPRSIVSAPLSRKHMIMLRAITTRYWYADALRENFFNLRKFNLAYAGELLAEVLPLIDWSKINMTPWKADDLPKKRSLAADIDYWTKFLNTCDKLRRENPTFAALKQPLILAAAIERAESYVEEYMVQALGEYEIHKRMDAKDAENPPAKAFNPPIYQPRGPQGPQGPRGPRKPRIR